MLTQLEKEVLYSQNCFKLGAWAASNLPTLDTASTLQLLTALPAIEVKNEAAFVTICKAWLRIQQCLGFYQQVRDDLIEFLWNNLLLEDTNAEIGAVLADLTKHFHRFGGRTRGDFVLWAYRRLQRHPDLRKYASIRDFINIEIDDFREATVSEADEEERLRDFTYTIHGEEGHLEYHIPIGQKENGDPVIWKVNTLDYAKGLWPVHAAKRSSGKYFVAKTVNGRHSVAVHRLKFNIGLRDAVKAYDDDFCNFCQILCVTTQQIFLGDWANKNHEKAKDGGLFKPAEGTAPGPVRVLGEEWIDNLHISHDRWGRPNPLADERQEKFENTQMRQFIKVGQDGDKTLEFGGWQKGSGPVTADDIVRATLPGRNISATWAKLSKVDIAEGNAVKQEMAVTTIRDRNREFSGARDGDEAGEERKNVIVDDRPTLVDDLEEAGK